MKKETTTTASTLPASKPEKEGKHTPGEWNFTNSNHSDFLDIDGDSRICSIDVSEIILEEQGITREEAEANARLIAAAPDMLEALNEVEDTLIEQLTEDLKENDSIIAMMNKVKAAIAKASNNQ